MIKFIKQILEYLDYEYDWDSYNAKVFTETHVEQAIHLLIDIKRNFNLIPAYVPPYNGGISLEYHNIQKDVDIEIDIIHDGRYAYLIVDNSGANTSYREAGDLTLDSLNEVLTSLVFA